MPYRDDLEAALAHAEAAERDLAAAREENQHDHERIAALEKQLAAAQHKLGEAKKKEPPPKPKPKPEKPKPDASSTKWDGTSSVVVIGLIVLIGGIIALGMFSSRGDGVKTVDIDGMLPDAKQKALKYLPDPELYQLKADYVPPSGISDLATYHGYVTYGFLSPTRRDQATPSPVGPIGAPQPSPNYLNCSVDVRYRETSMRYYETAARGDQCGEPLTHPPTCTVKEVWAEAIHRGAPQNALAGIRLDMKGHRGDDGKYRRVPLWRFSISDSSKTVFEMELPDGCPIVH
jgi:hypothetical protein